MLSLPGDLLLVRIIMVKIFADSCQAAVLYGHAVTLYFSLYIFVNVNHVFKTKNEQAGLKKDGWRLETGRRRKSETSVKLWVIFLSFFFNGNVTRKGKCKVCWAYF